MVRARPRRGLRRHPARRPRRPVHHHRRHHADPVRVPVGKRRPARWATITDAAGSGLRIEADPLYQLTTRRWTSEQLDAARHLTDLVRGDRVWVNVDLAQHGIGSNSCGPGVLDEHVLMAGPASLAVLLRRC
ncbi:hypothetical protein [Catellatospora methionotrophica]|uniref:hypothetical protein n=1 Tax=Catellatospora methionotrophica TaxID=121620 RepID=UPI0023B26FBE|nr:hypothetical protein [Catellatospora methionotrophica]